MTLKLNDILERARLHRSTVEYALKRTDVLRDMPKAGGKGYHRNFSLPQARNLSIACHLVMAGVPLRGAVNVLDFIDHQYRLTIPESFGKEMKFWLDSFEVPWMLELFDCRFVRVHRGVLNCEDAAFKLYLDLQKNESIRLPDVHDRLTFSELNLTKLEVLLAGTEI